MEIIIVFFSCLADMEDNNLLLNIISEPIPTKSRLIGKKSVVCFEDFGF
jgi:hypothetical protein